MTIALFVLMLVYVFWLLYLISMMLVTNRKKLTPVTKALGLPAIIMGVIVDFLMNISLACLVFWDLPEEFMVTQRLDRYLHGADGWRKTAAKFICNNLLDPFALGGHCK